MTGRRVDVGTREEESLVYLCLGLVRETRDGIVQQVVEQLLAELFVNIIIRKGIVPRRMSLYCIVCWSKEGGTV
jgi:hypothetical protein